MVYCWTMKAQDFCSSGKAYLARANERPLVGFFVGSYYPFHRYPAAKALPQGLFTPNDLDALAFARDCLDLYTLHTQCPGDLMWTATAFWGVPWVEAALGCAVEADHLTGSARSHPVDAPWPIVPTFSKKNPWVAKCLEMLQVVAEHAKERFPVGTTLMRGISDALAALLGFERMVFAMLDKPSRVHELARRIADFWIAFGHAQLDVIPRYGGGYGSFFYNLWAPGRCIWLQEDASTLLSPELFEEFILPYDREIASSFEYCFLHLHPGHYIPYRPLLDSDLAVIELHIDKGGPSAADLLPIYQEIQARKPLYVWGDIREEDLVVLLNNLEPQGLAIEVVVESPQEARSLYQSHFAGGIA